MDFYTKPKRGRPSNWDRALRNFQENSSNNQKYFKRLKANDRERSRMQNLNYMLKLLKSLLPIDFNENEERLTKIETLKLATEYIAKLTQMLNLTTYQQSSPDSTYYSESPDLYQTSQNSFFYE
jgi:hypothetical protein